MPYFLSAIGCEPVAELGEAWVLGIVAICLGYFVRGFKDTKEASYDDYRRERLERMINNEEGNI